MFSTPSVFIWFGHKSTIFYNPKTRFIAFFTENLLIQSTHDELTIFM